MELRYCQQCGGVLSQKEIGDEGLVPFCNNCNVPYFKTPKPCVLIAVINEKREIALLKQNRVSQTHWVLVAGYITEGESVEETVVRETLEETGLKVKSSKYITSYPYSKKELLLLGYIALVNKDKFGDSKEVDEIKWFPMEEAENFLMEGSIAKKHFYKAKIYMESLD